MRYCSLSNFHNRGKTSLALQVHRGVNKHELPADAWTPGHGRCLAVLCSHGAFLRCRKRVRAAGANMK